MWSEQLQVGKAGLPPLPSSFTSNCQQQIAAELLRLILPGVGASETRLRSQFADIHQVVLIRIFSVNLFTLSELHLHVKAEDAQQDLQVSAYITTLVMNYLFTGKFKRTK